MSAQDTAPPTIAEEIAARDSTPCRRCHVAIGADCHDSDGVSLADPPGSNTPVGALLIHPARLNDYRAAQGG